ncbi:MAG: hypothetical protein QE271_11290 [Bacteriovoracaceae bacterium]|nr:hypothetical protein [Bacteriovoracaceae bacterium]
MMNSRHSSPLMCMMKTVLICVFFDLFFMIFFPLISLKWVAVSVTQVAIIFLSFTVGFAWLPWGILTLQLFHSLFSLEGWALGTLIGVIICVVMSRLKAMIQLTGPLSIIMTTYFLQFAWCLMAGILTSLRNHDWKFFQLFVNQGLTYGLVTAALSPLLFFIFRNIWLVPTNPFDHES